ncbi:ADP-ribosylglycohydrolase-domain-containing protein [Flammula alnicola]|nr:ADP-ribosylglycohydrolase-domain-containing protein [Flammula alnicola]
MFFRSQKSKNKKSESAQGSAPKSPALEPSPLRSQFPTPAPASTKIRLSVLATALLPPGVWTDDTSMMLCLATSIATFKETPDSRYSGGFDEVHQLELYKRWHRDGYLSATGRCFDIGNTVSRALEIFARYNPEEALHRIRSDLSEEQNSGNGSLMRVLPIGLAHWRDESQAKIYAKRSSQATHPSLMCIEACEMWTGLIAPSDSQEFQFSKFTLLEYISNFPYTDNELRQALTLPFGVPPRPDGRAEREIYYNRYHPLLRLIQETQAQPIPKETKFPYNIPSEQQLPSSGYVLDTVVAALYCFFTTKTFEDGALMVVNLGNDADTVGAVYAGLAACWYCAEEGRAEGIFWTKNVREWRKALVRRNLVEEVAENLVILLHILLKNIQLTQLFVPIVETLLSRYVLKTG